MKTPYFLELKKQFNFKYSICKQFITVYIGKRFLVCAVK